MINWNFLELKNVLVIGAIVLLTRLAFSKAIAAIDGNNSSTVVTN